MSTDDHFGILKKFLFQWEDRGKKERERGHHGLEKLKWPQSELRNTI